MSQLASEIFIAQVIAEEGAVAIRPTRGEAIKFIADWARGQWRLAAEYDGAWSDEPDYYSDLDVITRWFDDNDDEDGWKISRFIFAEGDGVEEDAIRFSLHGQATTTPPYANVKHPWMTGDSE